MALFKSFSLITNKLSPVLTVATQLKTTMTSAISSTVEKVVDTLADSSIGQLLESATDKIFESGLGDTIASAAESIDKIQSTLSNLANTDILAELSNLLFPLLAEVKEKLSDGIQLEKVLELIDSLKYVVNHVLQNNETIQDSELLSGLIDGISQLKSAIQNVGTTLGIQLDLKELILKLEPAVDVLNKFIIGAIEGIEKVAEVIAGLTDALTTLTSSLNSASSVDSLLSSLTSHEIDLNSLLDESIATTTAAKSSSLLDINPISSVDSTLAELLQPSAFI